MPESVPQSYANHRRLDPAFHVVLFGAFVVNAIYALVLVVKAPSFGTIWTLVMAAMLILFFFKVRLYPLTVQDRVIRLEERLRLERLLAEPLKSRIGELSPRQLVGLRFASDGEVAALVQQALDEKLDGEAIKKRIQTWRPDTLRV